MIEPLPRFPKPTAFPVPPDLEAQQRRQVVEAALSWCGTPYRNCGYVKGPTGACDCSMLLVGAFVEGRVFQPFDPRPYSSTWMLHKSTEKYLAWLDTIGDRTTKPPQPGDVIAYVFGRCYSHAAIVVDDKYVVHAFADARSVQKTEIDWHTLQRVRGVPRPQITYDMWAKLRMPL